MIVIMIKIMVTMVKIDQPFFFIHCRINREELNLEMIYFLMMVTTSESI